MMGTTPLSTPHTPSAGGARPRRLVVLGGGESGTGAAVLAQAKGMDVMLSDMGAIKPQYKQLLDKHRIRWEEQRHTESNILNADEIVKSPGIPDTAPIIVKARQRGIPIISEIEFAGRYTDARMVCITGSNGKTTTTMLTYHILREAGLNVGLAGNVGKSLALQVATEHHDVYVIELSSFQLDNMYEFKANVAVLLNITPDHLDRYDHKMENYTAAKFRIIRNQTSDDTFIFWHDDPIIAAQLASVATEARMLPFSGNDDPTMAAWLADGNLHFAALDTDDTPWQISAATLPIKGLHNIYNTMAAGISSRVMGVSPDVVCRAMQSFQAVEHRLEFVRSVGGVTYINDSKATNVNSTWYALESMRERVVLILGGKDKGNDYTEIESLVRQKVAAIVCLGVDNTKLHAFFDGMVPTVVDARSMEECVARCAELAQPGQTVLLSPCCASFDLFKSYEDRGTQFKQQVAQLPTLNS